METDVQWAFGIVISVYSALFILLVTLFYSINNKINENSRNLSYVYSQLDFSNKINDLKEEVIKIINNKVEESKTEIEKTYDSKLFTKPEPEMQSLLNENKREILASFDNLKNELKSNTESTFTDIGPILLKEAQRQIDEQKKHVPLIKDWPRTLKKVNRKKVSPPCFICIQNIDFDEKKVWYCDKCKIFYHDKCKEEIKSDYCINCKSPLQVLHRQ